MNTQLSPLQSYIADSLAKGHTLDKIQSNLVSAGWSPEQIAPFLHPTQPPPLSAPVVTPPVVSPVVSPHVPLLSPLTLSSLLLRVGLAFVFVFAAISLSLNPSEGMHFLPPFVSYFVSPSLFLTLFGVYEIILSVWLLSGKFSLYAGLIAATTLVVITGLNFSDFSVLFRNVAIVFAALALASLPPASKSIM